MVVVVVLLVLLGAVVVYKFFPGNDWTQFRPDTLSGLIAVVVGVPVALLTSRMLEGLRRSGQWRVIRDGLVAEIRVHKSTYENLRNERKANPSKIPLTNMDCPVQLWRTVSASGGLVETVDAKLLEALAAAYYYADNMNRYIRLLLQAHLSSIGGPYSPDAVGRLWDQMEPILETAYAHSASVVAALEAKARKNVAGPTTRSRKELVR